MSSKRSSSSSSGSRFTEEDINALVSKLQALLPDSTSNTAKVVEETCKYIKRLHREVDGLCERLSHILSSIDTNNNNLDLETLLRNLLQQ